MKKLRYLDNTVVLELHQEKCIGCGNCELVCPHRVFRLDEKKATIIDRNGCMECGACAKNCPTDAIYVNPDEGCGCAAYIINSWLSRFTRKKSSRWSC
jgi:NAD-dependent dihydropyrimidine dehydrogenase PreA subunit